jgi:transposase
MTVAPTHPVGVCPRCGKVSGTIHQTRTREHIKDLSISNSTVNLTVRVHQFECRRCGQCFTPAIAFLAEGAHATERFLERAAQLIRTSDVANTAAFLGVPERTLANWYYDYLQRRPNPDGQKIKPVRRAGIDELSLKKRPAIRRGDR